MRLEVVEDGDVLDLDDVIRALDDLGMPKPTKADLDAPMAEPEFRFAENAVGCAYFRSFLEASLSPDEHPPSRHTWLLNKFVRLVTAGIRGCVSDDEFKSARQALADRFTAMLASDGFDHGRRGAGAAEISGLWAWAKGRAGGKTAAEVSTEWPCSGKHGGSDNKMTVDRRQQIEDEVFGASPQLGHIRQAARSRLVSPWAVLACTLGRLAAAHDPGLQLPALVGGRGSLNIAFGLVGPSGSGKSASNSVTDELVGELPFTVSLVTAGTGEGLMNTFLTWDREAKKHKLSANPLALMFVDEIGQLGAIQDRSGSSIASVLRTMITGAHTGTNNAEKARNRSLPAHSYSIGVIAGIQPALSDVLLSDADAGTPQRWIWLPALDPFMPDDEPEWPGDLTIRWDILAKAGTLAVADSISKFVKQNRRRGAKGEADAINGHMVLMRLKVAALLALLHGEAEVTERWWQVAALIIELSDSVRGECIGEINRKRQKEAIARGIADHAREEARQGVRGDKVERVAHTVHNAVAKRLGEGAEVAAMKYITLAVSGANRPYKAEAIEFAIERDWIVHTENGFVLGDSRPR